MKISPIATGVADEIPAMTASIPAKSGSNSFETLPACDGVDRGTANDAGSGVVEVMWLAASGRPRETAPVIGPRLIRGGLRSCPSP